MPNVAGKFCMFSALVENVTGLMFLSIGLVTKWQGSQLPDPTPVGAKGTSHKRDDYSIKRTKEGGGFFPLKVLGPGPLLAPQYTRCTRMHTYTRCIHILAAEGGYTGSRCGSAHDAYGMLL